VPEPYKKGRFPTWIPLDGLPAARWGQIALPVRLNECCERLAIPFAVDGERRGDIHALATHRVEQRQNLISAYVNSLDRPACIQNPPGLFSVDSSLAV